MSEIRRLTAADAGLWRELRHEALNDHPSNFTAAFEDEAECTVDEYAEAIGRDAFFGALDAARLVGGAAFRREEGAKVAHKGVLYGMYVRPDARGRALGEKLVRAVIAHARNEVERLSLGVGAGNLAAIALYESCGFVPWAASQAPSRSTASITTTSGCSSCCARRRTAETSRKRKSSDCRTRFARVQRALTGETVIFQQDQKVLAINDQKT